VINVQLDRARQQRDQISGGDRSALLALSSRIAALPNRNITSGAPDYAPTRMKVASVTQAKRREGQESAIAAAAAAAVADPTVAPIFKAFAVLEDVRPSALADAEVEFYQILIGSKAAGPPCWVADPAIAAAARSLTEQRQKQHSPQFIDPGAFPDLHHWWERLGKDVSKMAEPVGRSADDPRALFMQQHLREAAWAAYSERGFEALAHAGALPELQQVRAREGGEGVEGAPRGGGERGLGVLSAALLLDGWRTGRFYLVLPSALQAFPL